jgi:hypothetical protein
MLRFEALAGDDEEKVADTDCAHSTDPAVLTSDTSIGLRRQRHSPLLSNTSNCIRIN